MTVKETIDYLKACKYKAEKDSDPRSKKFIDAIESALILIDERRALQNRCAVFSSYSLCIFCNFDCEARIVDEKEECIKGLKEKETK